MASFTSSTSFSTNNNNSNNEEPPPEQINSLYDQVQKLQEQVRLRELYRIKVTDKITELIKEGHLMDGKISGIQSNFNKLHELTQNSIKATKRKRKERIAGEREIENLKRHIRNNSIEINKYNKEINNYTNETNDLKASLKKIGNIILEIRRRIQKNKLDASNHAITRNSLVVREKTIKSRVDQSISQNAKSIMQIERLLMDVDRLNNEPL